MNPFRRIGYNTYDLDYFFKIGGSYEQSNKCKMFIQTDENKYILLSDFKKVYPNLNKETQPLFPLLIKEEKKWTLNYNIIDNCLVVLKTKD
jgi:hypothetical protein